MVVMVLCMGYSIVTYIQLFVNVQNKNTKAYKMALDTTFGHSFVDLDILLTAVLLGWIKCKTKN